MCITGAKGKLARCGVSDMEWIMLLNYANCLWSPTVGNQFQCLCATVLNLFYCIEGIWTQIRVVIPLIVYI